MESDPIQPLFLEILKHPDDDAKRLAYADWLNANGQEVRAEFIHAQCTLHSPSQSAALSDAERTLLKAKSNAYEQSSIEEVKTVFKDFGPTSWVFRRGFIERFDGGIFSDEADATHVLQLFKKAPILYVRDSYQLVNLKSVRDALPDLPYLRGLELNSVYCVDDNDLETILMSPKMAQLEILLIHHDRNGNLIDDGVLVRALMSPHRVNLRVLGVNVDFTWRGPSHDVVSAIAESPYLRNLQKLYLTNMTNMPTANNPSAITLDTVDNISRSENFTNLKVLDLRGNEASAEMWESLASAFNAPRLEKVFINECKISPGYLEFNDKMIEHFRAHFGECVDLETPIHYEGDVHWDNRIGECDF